MSYAAIRGQSTEEGAVQRLLNTRRIISIKDFALNGDDFPNSIVLNWVSVTHTIMIKTVALNIPEEPLSAQLIDGQHRADGPKDAIDERPILGDIHIPVTIYMDLNTKQCADLFLVH